ERKPVSDKHTAAFLEMMFVHLHGKLSQAKLLPEDLDLQIRDGVYDRARFLADPDNFESGYNHGITEAAALFLATEAFPEMAEVGEWRSLALTRLKNLVDATIDADGAEV